MKILLAEHSIVNGKNAGSKARLDVLDILRRNGYIHVPLYSSKTNKVVELLSIIKAFLNLWKKTKRNGNDIIFVEHPYTPFLFCSIVASYVKHIKTTKKSMSILLIHDIESIRYGKVDVKKEISVFNKYDVVVCHNDKMKRFLGDHGCNSELISLGIFDYLVKDQSEIKEISYSNEPVICFAGNLSRSKSGFLYKLSSISNVHFRIYGVGFDESYKNLEYMGSFSSTDIVQQLDGNYGLVWDGPSIENNDSPELNYLRIISPHKFSLYIVAGLPVIVWSESALADFVIHNKIGITIDNLTELPEKLQFVTQDEYERFISNIKLVRNKIISGNFLNDVIFNVEDRIK